MVYFLFKNEVKMKLVQVTLENDKKERFTTWVDNRKELRPGVKVTLKDYRPNVKWTVYQVFEAQIDAKDIEFHRKWDNNNYDKHEGLVLK